MVKTGVWHPAIPGTIFSDPVLKEQVWIDDPGMVDEHIN